MYNRTVIMRGGGTLHQPPGLDIRLRPPPQGIVPIQTQHQH